MSTNQSSRNCQMLLVESRFTSALLARYYMSFSYLQLKETACQYMFIAIICIKYNFTIFIMDL